MTKASIRLQDLRKRIYVQAKAKPTWRFWGLYVHICKMETLRTAYQMAKANRGAPGIDGVTFEAIEETCPEAYRGSGVEGFLEQIRNELISGTYQPMPSRKQEIPKGNGKYRVSGYLVSGTVWCKEQSSSCWNRSLKPTFKRARMATDRSGRPMLQ